MNANVNTKIMIYYVKFSPSVNQCQLIDINDCLASINSVLVLIKQLTLLMSILILDFEYYA